MGEILQQELPVTPRSRNKIKASVSIVPDSAHAAQKIAGRIAHAPLFTNLMALLILFNMVVIIVETDHAAETDDSLLWVEVVGWLILIIFILELALRLFAFRASFFNDGWNRLDFVIVVTDALFSLVGLVFGSVFPMSILRVCRLCKLARVSKVFRIFPELRLMMAGLVGSLRAIFWGSVLLMFVLLVWSIIAVQFIHPLNKNLHEQGYYEGCDRCSRAYATVMAAQLTFCQQIVAGDSWGQATVPIIEEHPVTAIYFMAVFLSVGIGFLNLILGVVVQVAQQEHDRLKIEMEDERKAALMEKHRNLRAICEDMDTDESGDLCLQELLSGYIERQDFREACNALELCQEDMAVVFTLMDLDHSGVVSYDEFVNEIYKIKTTDTTFVLAYIKYYITCLKDVILNQLKIEENILVEEEQELKEIHRISTSIEGATVMGNSQNSHLSVERIDTSQGNHEIVFPRKSFTEFKKTRTTMEVLEDHMKEARRSCVVHGGEDTDHMKEARRSYVFHGGEDTTAVSKSASAGNPQAVSKSAPAESRPPVQQSVHQLCKESRDMLDVILHELREATRDIKVDLQTYMSSTSHLLSPLEPSAETSENILSTPEYTSEKISSTPEYRGLTLLGSTCCRQSPPLTTSTTLVVPCGHSLAEPSDTESAARRSTLL